MIGILLAWAAIFGLALAIGGEQFRSRWAHDVILLFAHWSVITYLLWLANEFRTHSFAAPEVKNIRLEDKLLLVSPKEWLGVSVAVLIYVQEESYERLLCSGAVINQQRNGLVQIALDLGGLEQEAVNGIHQRLTGCALGKIVIKPGQSQK